MRVVKIGGNELDQPGFLGRLAQALAETPQATVLVHGGGKAVDELQRRLGLETIKVQGLRRTDADSLVAATMTLCGSVSVQIVRSLLASGVDAVGLCGVDGGLLRARKLALQGVDLGWVGEVVAVRDDLLQALLAKGITPVIAPISFGLDGEVYNVNADQVAGAVALALGAERLDFISNVPGVRRGRSTLATLHQAEAERLIACGEIEGGMVPKVRAALAAVTQGVPRARIVDLAGLNGRAGTTLLPDLPSPSRPQPRVQVSL